LELVCKAIDEYIIASEKIFEHYPDARIFALFGKMGAGKTTFIKYLCKALGAEETAKSPTFAIINEYEISPQSTVYSPQKNKNSPQIENNSPQTATNIYHFDFYRIKNESEAFDIGYEEYFYSGNYCFIEWPEKIENLLPQQYVRIDIFVNNDETRSITVNNKI
jgi:tRNA threonylcarbamoyladenosine biosynthesis protein TsaE